MFDMTVSAALSMLRAIRARARQGRGYTPAEEVALGRIERMLAPTAPGFVAQRMRASLGDCPVLGTERVGPLQDTTAA